MKILIILLLFTLQSCDLFKNKKTAQTNLNSATKSVTAAVNTHKPKQVVYHKGFFSSGVEATTFTPCSSTANNPKIYWLNASPDIMKRLYSELNTSSKIYIKAEGELNKSDPNDYFASSYEATLNVKKLVETNKTGKCP